MADHPVLDDFEAGAPDQIRHAPFYLPSPEGRRDFAENLVNAIDEMKERGVWVVGVDTAGVQEWTGFDYRDSIALVLGGEHRGLRRLVREHCDALVRLPMLGKISSLNISVAAGVVLYEVVRQRRL